MSQGLRVMRRYKDAEAALESAIALRPNWASPYCQLASVLEAQERYGDALVATQQEVRLSIDPGPTATEDLGTRTAIETIRQGSTESCSRSSTLTRCGIRQRSFGLRHPPPNLSNQLVDCA
jgi:hypothetical protein